MQAPKEAKSSSGVSSQVQVEQLLEKALILIELTLDLRDKSHIGEKYACDLKSLAWKACQITSAIQQSSKDFLQLAEHIIRSALEIIDKRDGDDSGGHDVTVREDAVDHAVEKVKEAQRVKEHTDTMYRELTHLQNILKKDIQLYERPSEIKLFKTKSSSSIGDMIKTLQTKQHQKRRDCNSPRICQDERYPERASRESLLEQASPALQTVHENGNDFSQRSLHDTSKAAGGLSMKSVRRIKRYLQDKAEADDPDYDEDGSRASSRSYSRLDRSGSSSSRDVEYTETVLKNEGSHLNVLLQNISEED